jgi:O-antigen ligase
MSSNEPNTLTPTRLSTAAFLLLCSMIVFAVITYGAVDALAISILGVGTLVLVVLWFWDGWRAGRLQIGYNALLLPLIGLAVLGTLQLLPLARATPGSDVLRIPASAALSMDPFATRMFVVRTILLAVFLAAAFLHINTVSRVKKTAIFLLSFGTLMAFFGIIQKLAEPGAIYGMRETPQAIPFGPYVNQHHFAALMVMLSGPAIGLIASRVRRDMLPLLLIAAAMLAIAVVFSGSRGGMLSYTAMAATIAAAYLMRRGDASDGEDRSKLATLLPAAAGMALLAAVIVGAVIMLGAGENLLRGVGLGGVTDDISSGRLHFWQVALQIFASNPVLGAGLDAFGSAFTQFDTRNGMFRVEQAHNDYLQILADGGIIGFLCVAAFVFILLRQGYARMRGAAGDWLSGLQAGAFAGCVGVLLHSFFDFPLRTHANAYVFLLLALIAVQPIVLEARRRRSSER